MEDIWKFIMISKIIKQDWCLLFAMTSAFSWQNSVSLCSAWFYTPRPSLSVTPGISWVPTFTFQSPMMKRTSYLGVSSRRSCRSSQNYRFFRIMANRWGNSANIDRLYFGGLQITVDGECSHELKRPLLIRRKDMTNLDSILKSRDITCQQKSI